MKEVKALNGVRLSVSEEKLYKKSNELIENIRKKGNVSIHQISNRNKDERKYYRLLENDKLEEERLIKVLTTGVEDKVSGCHVLSIEDTSDINYWKNRNRIEDITGLGEVSNNKGLGYFLHPSLVVDTEDASIKGFADIYLSNRPYDRTYNKSTRSKRKIEEKESYKWLAGFKRSNSSLSKADHITVVADREADVYEFLSLSNERTDIIVRSKSNRKIINSEEKLHDLISKQPISEKYELKIKDSKKRKSRTAILTIKYCKAKIQRPKNLPKTLPEYLEVTVIKVKECPETIPEDSGEEAIEWLLVTTHEVKDWIDAIQIVYWYSLRWLIEEVFRILKKQGLNLESSQLTTGKRLRKMGIMALEASTRILQLRQARKDISIKIKSVFSEDEQECLQELLPELEGNTDLQKNPYSCDTLAWAVWIIARLGGWKGYQSQRPPGVITLKRGLDRFEAILVGYQLSQKTRHKENENSD